jgi:quercetin dioxygenase-like cupin family protein
MAETYVRAGKINWSATGSNVRVQERTLAPGQVIPWHYHTLISDKTYCLGGTVQIDMLDPSERIVLAVGESYMVPPNRPHHISPQGDEPCHFLLVQGVGEYDRHPIEPEAWKPSER